MLAIGLLILGIITRIFIHAPNFTPILALALFSGVYLNKKIAIALPLSLMVLTDLIIGVHSTMIFTWFSIALICGLGLYLRDKKSIKNVALSSVFSAVLFFIVSNLGVWIVGGLYPMTFAGLTECFYLAIPFFRNTLVSTLLYTGVFFGLYEFLELRLMNKVVAQVSK